ncbi:PREDICTED: endonuclease III-like protein 1 [Drosophila arizonae]|uniref:Endonuclease III homolog n=1 Tax=Drosophila arizonae TaxID=7263 RepID=A0ABM1NYA5_DROAR|nr:PREDICTED: endonuclease III-like protein 1 [Drosophila arizonae]
MQHFYKTIIRTMASKKATLSSKLAKQVKPEKPTVKTELWDIEELPSVAAARYFSPVQTRKQRQLNSLPESNVPAKKSRLAAISKTSKIQMGKATIIKCELVPECDKVPEIKAESATPVKIEPDFPNINWLQHLENIRLMRSEKPAPVDTMGCHKCADANANEKTQRFHILVGLMLSSQTKDETTFEAMKRLKAQTLTPARLKDIPGEELERLLHPVSFYKNKAKYLKQTSEILVDKYNEDIPNNIKELLKLPGVGPKMAHICMATAWQEITGIGVDTHVHRIANRLAWLKKPTKEPEQTRIQLESWLPRPLWAEVNHLLVGFGQTICTPVKPNCSECLNKDICPAALLPKKK